MRIYNTLTKKIEEFIPHTEGIVNLYTCGPTVYYYAHIGNLRTYLFEDILEKSLVYEGYQVKRVMNITDVGHLTSDADTGEDKMLKGAKREGKTILELADFYTKAFLGDMTKLNIKHPEIIAKATDHVSVYIKVIQALLDKGYAYQASGNVYFDISKIPNYYELSGKNPDDLIVAVRDSVEEDKEKRNPFDFGLWFTNSKFNDQDLKWDSPWGVGYPGWHIECSSIASEYLGEYVDIHCGGVDNIFPHHSNEIAQSEGYFGHKWCNYWMHGEHLNDASGKMSKSNGDALTLNTLIKNGYSPLAYRYFCLGSHYRKQLVFTYESLDIASNAYQKLLNKVSSLKKNDEELNEEAIKEYKAKFMDAIDNDLNTSMMLTVLFDVLKDNNLNDNTKLWLVEDFDKVLSLDLISKQQDIVMDQDILDKIKLRDEAKKNKDYIKADKIRDELLSVGIQLIDSRDGTIYKRI